MLRMSYCDDFSSVCPCVCPLTFSNDFSSEVPEPVLLKFYMEPPKVVGTKNCENGRSPLTKMAAMPIYGKKL